MLVGLLLPSGTVVLVIHYFSRLSTSSGLENQWIYTLLALAGGLSAVMAALLLVSVLVVYQQRNRFQRLHLKQNQFLNSVLEERLRMARSLDVLGAAHQVTLAIKQETSFERIASVVLEQIEFFSRAEDVIVYASSSERELEARARRFLGVNSFGEETKLSPFEPDLAYEAILSGKASRDFNPQTGSYAVAIPFSAPGAIQGVVEIRRTTHDDPDFQNELLHFEASLQQLVKAVSLGLKFSALWDRAIKDEMTGLYNKNHFNKEMPVYLDQAMKNSKTLSLIMLDIDKFKEINDCFGHLYGDQILRQVSAILLEELRDTDIAFRYGGEELSIVCPHTSADDAARFAERLRSIIAHTEFRSEAGQLIPVSTSVGVAEFLPEHMKNEEELKDACDQALYFAKEHGRNLVVVNRGSFENKEKSQSKKGASQPFEALSRSGDVESEVKRRLGLAGDNKPLEPAKPLQERRKARAKPDKTKPKKTQENTKKEDIKAELEKHKAASKKNFPLSESLRASIAKACETQNQKSEQTSQKAQEESPEQVSNNKPLKAQKASLRKAPRKSSAKGASDPAKSVGKSIKKTSAKKASRKAKPKQSQKPDSVQEGSEAVIPADSGAPAKKVSPSKKKVAKRTRKKAAQKVQTAQDFLEDKPERTMKQESAVLKAIEAKTYAELDASDDSDRLDFISEQEGEQLLSGKPPKKSLRKEQSEDQKLSSSWKPHKHW